MKASLAIVLALASFSLCTINPGAGIPDATIMPVDVYSADYTRIFDYSAAKGNVKQTTSNGLVFSMNQPVNTRSYAAFGVTKLYLVKWVAHNISVFVYDKNKIIIQTLDGNGKIFLKALFYEVKIIADLYCSAFEYNDLRNLLYIGCVGQRTKTAPGKFFIFTYDISLEDVSSSLSLDQKDGFDIKNQLVLKIVKSPQNSNEDTYLIAYDQGHGQQTSSRHNSQFRVFRNVAYRQLTFYYLGNIAAYDHDTAMLFDIFTYNGTILTTGRVEEDKEHISFAQCKLDNSKRVMNCGQIKQTLIQEGYVQIHNESVLLTTDLKTRIVTVYQLYGDYTDPNWVSHTINTISNVDLVDKDGVWINGTTFSEYGAAISYTTNVFGEEFGSTFINWGINSFMTSPQYFGFVWQRSIFYGDAQTGNSFVSRNTRGELLIDQAFLARGDNTVTVTAQDNQNSQSASAKITLMSVQDWQKTITWNKIADSTVAQNSAGTLPIDSMSINSGNALFASAISSNKNVLTIKKAFYGAMVGVNFEGITDLSGNFYFDGNSAVVENNRKLSFQTCTQKDGPGEAIDCHAQGAYTLKQGDILGEKILNLSNGVTLAYIINVDQNRTTLITVSDTGVSAYAHPGIVQDVAKYNQVTASLDYIAIAEDNAVVILAVNVNDQKDWQIIQTLTATDFDETDFCPVEIRSQKINPKQDQLGQQP